MALYKDMLEEKMKRFNELKEKEETSLKTLESLPINSKTLNKVQVARANLEEVFELCYEDLYNSYEDYRLREEPKPEQFIEEPKPEQFQELPMRVGFIDKNTTGLLEENTIGPVEENPDEEVQQNGNIESEDDKEKTVGWKCPNCGCEDHEPGAKFCHVCGALISGATNEKDMEENGQLRINFETEEETEQDNNAEVEENGQLRIPFENDEETEDNEK